MAPPPWLQLVKVHCCWWLKSDYAARTNKPPAAEIFRKLKDEQPDDPLYDYYLKRIDEFKDDPPPPEWQGEIRFTVK